MTPTQLRAFAAVVRLGSVKAAAQELGVTEAAVSLHVSQLRKELGDRLFRRSAAGLAFTPGGLRLASRAVEMLGLQERTVMEVRQAGEGRRLLRLGVTSLFAEYAAPGLIEQFTDHVRDLDVELSIVRSQRAAALLHDRVVDAAVTTIPHQADPHLESRLILRYQVVALAGRAHPILGLAASSAELRRQRWLLGPSATEQGGAVSALLARLRIDEERLQIFQSHAAAVEEVKRGRGVTLLPAFTVPQDLAEGALVRIPGSHLEAQGAWHLSTLAAENASQAARELARFASQTRATQAMLRGRGATLGRFRPTVHVTLWS
jgi:DNA-binding transcriptional LysR family regulator